MNDLSNYSNIEVGTLSKKEWITPDIATISKNDVNSKFAHHQESTTTAGTILGS